MWVHGDPGPAPKIIEVVARWHLVCVCVCVCLRISPTTHATPPRRKRCRSSSRGGDDVETKCENTTRVVVVVAWLAGWLADG
mmetsp:Transcript_34065/g.98136  ORF Transcript_34065/g.98136 Transcript_34065/m.98136 type:complete len:82 (-) Transcript_34065:49-294(-)